MALHHLQVCHLISYKFDMDIANRATLVVTGAIISIFTVMYYLLSLLVGSNLKLQGIVESCDDWLCSQLQMLGLFNTWQTYLSDILNIKLEKEFQRSRKVLASSRKQQTQKGLANKPNGNTAIT